MYGHFCFEGLHSVVFQAGATVQQSPEIYESSSLNISEMGSAFSQQLLLSFQQLLSLCGAQRSENRHRRRLANVARVRGAPPDGRHGEEEGETLSFVPSFQFHLAEAESAAAGDDL